MTASSRAATVLVGVDDTSHTHLAAAWAAAQAQRWEAGLRVVHAVEAEDDKETEERVTEAAAQVLDDVRRRITAAHPGLCVDTVLARDEPAEALLAAVPDAALLVVGTRGRGGFAGLLLGSVSQKVAAHAACPVIVVRGHPDPDVSGAVVVGVRDERDEPAVRFALAEAERRAAPVRLLHAWRPTGGAGPMVPEVSRMDDERDAHAALLNHAARPVAEFPRVHVETELAVGSAAGALVAASNGAGLVVVPRHPAGRFGTRLGSVVHAVLHHAECPVAVVPTGGDG
ncbi:universal stress protein [Streptomyces sp. TRM68416]|uniref:universal stress protein n=1 Tax=Streptomyces sp. TRM68416 TaxID=2758412 RepID=UPI001661F3DF|nr:universal stress protein [Streptomyces sp. TRM68416]MBD0840643.1 universal stress protein [Streptomyces sp. TRM68416]